MMRLINGITSLVVLAALATVAHASPVGTSVSPQVSNDAIVDNGGIGTGLHYNDAITSGATTTEGTAESSVAYRFVKPQKETKPKEDTTGNEADGTEPVPEPATALLIGLGLAAVGGYRFRR